MSRSFKGFSVRELRLRRLQILRATAEAIGVRLDGEPPLDVVRTSILETRPDIATHLDAFLAADDALMRATEQNDISEHDYATAVTARTIARNSLEAAAKVRADASARRSGGQ